MCIRLNIIIRGINIEVINQIEKAVAITERVAIRLGERQFQLLLTSNLPIWNSNRLLYISEILKAG